MPCGPAGRRERGARHGVGGRRYVKQDVRGPRGPITGREVPEARPTGRREPDDGPIWRPTEGTLGTLEISRIATDFMIADMEYVRLVGLMVDFDRKGRRSITAEEIHAAREAKGRRDRLEAQMFALWEEESGGAGAE